MLSAALDLAANGWHVIPLAGKVPAMRGRGVLDASNDPDQIRAWWERAPHANIGARVPTNVVVIDVDPRNGGADSLAQLTDRHGQLPVTLTCISGRRDGGTHRYYRAPEGKLTARLLGPGIDVKTAAGYCVAPPSIHPDTGWPYQWERDSAPIVAPPEWLVDLIRPPAPAPRRPVTPRVRLDGRASVADTFTAATSWADVLQPHGWRCKDTNPDADGARWLHPAATSDCSATVRHGCLFVYSCSTPLPVTEAGDPHGLTRFRAWAVLNHHGDLSAGARALTQTGAV